MVAPPLSLLAGGALMNKGGRIDGWIDRWILQQDSGG